MAIGDDADVLLRIRARDDGGLRLLDAYRKEVQRLRRDLEELNRTGPRTQDEQERVTGLERIRTAQEYQKIQNQAFAEQARHIQQEQQAYTQAFQARSSAQRRYNAAETAAHIENQRRTTASNNQNAQYQNSQLRFQQRLNQAHAQALQMDARLSRQRAGGAAGSGSNLNALAQEDALWNRLRNSVLAYWAARQAGRAILGFVKEGLEFNQVLETAQLGIASLITATSKVRDANGNLLEGAKALEGAYGLAADQMQKIRIAGLQTAATTEQLVDAFQQALGPGLKAGLNLDQIRQVTVQIVQAAGAIGLPFNQLNQEVRSILDATIDRNSRVARVLSITNEEVKQAREQGKLAEFLNEKMAAFTVAGGRAAQTMFVLKSNIKEAFQVFAGQATSDLFTKMRDSLNKVFADAFDFKNLRIAEKFQGLVQAIQTAFSGVGDLFVSALTGAIKGAEELSAWFERNKIQVGLTVSAFVELSRQIGGALADIIRFASNVVGIGTETNLIAVAIRTIADGIRVIRDNAGFLLATFVGTKLAVAAMRLDLVEGVLPALKSIVAFAAANPWLIMAVAAGTLLTTIIAIKEAQAAHHEMVIRTTEALAKQRGDDIADLAKLSRLYADQTEALNKTTRGTDAYKKAQADLRDTYRDILKLAPELKNLDDFEQKSLKDKLIALKKVTDQRIADLEVQEAAAFNARANVEAQLAAEKAKPIQFGASGLIVNDNSGKIADLQQQFNDLDRTYKALVRADLVATTAVHNIGESLATLNTKPSNIKTKGAANDPEQIRAAALERARIEFEVHKSELEKELELDKISQGDFKTQMIAAINARANAELEAHRKLLAVTTDKGERAKIEADIFKAEQQRIIDINNFERDAHKETVRQEKRDLVAQVKEIRDTIAASKADIKSAAADIGRRVVSGEISKQQGASELQAALQDQIDKTTALIANWEDLKKTTSDPAALTTIDRILVMLNGHLADLNIQVNSTNAILTAFGEAFRKSTESNLADALDTLLEKSHSLAGVWRQLDDVFRQMTLSILADISKIISRMIAMQIVESAVGFFGGLFGGGAAAGLGSTPGIATAASGGLILGPGTSTSDSIPARLSTGEYVVNAAAVRKVGIDALDMINYGAQGGRLRSRNGSYAAGGMVESAMRAGGIAALRVGLDQGLILQTMRSPEGARIHVEHATKHRNKLRAIAGGVK